MKVLDLQCSASHVFEGWFGSEEDFRGQMERGLVECPMCGDRDVSKRLSAPRLNLGATAPSEPAVAPAPPSGPATALQSAYLRVVREVMARTEDVGERFAEEARRMHYGETAERGIRGQATPDEAAALLEEGVPVLPLPIPKALKGPLQ